MIEESKKIRGKEKIIEKCSELPECKIVFEKEIGIKYSGKYPYNLRGCKYN
jgi:hypothetical protein